MPCPGELQVSLWQFDTMLLVCSGTALCKSNGVLTIPDDGYISAVMNGNLKIESSQQLPPLQASSELEAFHHLSPEKVLDILERWDFEPTGRSMILNSYENRVYRLETENNGWVVGKFYRPGRWTDAAIADEHTFLNDLKNAGVPVAMPLQSKAGGTLEHGDNIRAAVYEMVAGRNPQELNDDTVRRLGRQLAMLHNEGAKRPAEHRLKLTPETYGETNLAWLMDNNILPEEAKVGYEMTVQALLQRVTPMFKDVPYLRIHGDCHLGNLIEAQSDMFFVDFDDMVMGPAVQDVWMLVASADKEGARQRGVLLEGYKELRDFSDSWLRLVEPLRALRYIHYSTWIARRFEDPTFKRTFTHFGDLKYWQNETNDLREQIARIDALADPYY